MEENYIYTFFNNETIAGLISLFFVSYIGLKIYKRQKKIDRFEVNKYEIIDDIFLLKSEIQRVLMNIDSMANTFIQGDMEKDSFRESLKNHEGPRLSKLVNDNIPDTYMRILSKIELYSFSENNKVQEATQNLKKSIKSWHDTVVYINFDIKKRVKDQPNLAIDNINNNIKLLVDAINCMKMK